MMSVSAMAGGQGEYYAGLAREDYYLEGGEPPGLWMGEGAKRLGLSDTVNRETFLELFDGFKDGEKLVQNAGKNNHRPGWDLTFSAPKTVSTAWSQADRETQLEIQAAHLTAVEKAVGYLEQNALWTRTGKGGAELERCQGVVATFEHGTSRAQDPQLHTHALLLNIGVREDGKTSTLETRPVYLAKMTAGALYRSELAYQLERRLGLFAELRTKDTTFDLQGVSLLLADTFSTRRKEIQEALAKKGLTSSRAAEVAALDTREAKGHISREKLFEKCGAVGKEVGWGREELNALMRGPQKQRDQGPLFSACGRVTQALTEKTAYFTERELLRRVAEASQVLAVGAEAVQWAVKDFLQERRDIVRVGMRHKEAVYTTKEMLETERQLLKMAKDSAGARWQGVAEETMAKVMHTRPTMKEEQRAALKHITQQSGTITSVTGMAGTGKTYLLDAAREALEASGYRVLGAALAGKAAEGLQDGSGIKSSTLASLFKRLENGLETLDAKTVLVVDEAGMVGTRQMHKLLSETTKTKTKLVLVGDEKQLQPIDAGGPFGAISRQIGTAKLSDIVRQDQKWHRQAVKDFAAGEATRALHEFARRGLLTVASDREAARSALMEAWKPGGLADPKKNLIVAATNADARALNREIQTLRLKQAGKVDSPKVTLDGQAFYAGDRIVFTRNSRMVGVRNGTFGTLISVADHEVKVMLDDGKLCRFSPEKYAHAKLGYAVTTHKAQGATVDNVFILTNESMQDRQQTYVQASRARFDARFFTTQAEAGDHLAALAKAMGRSNEKLMAVDLKNQGEGQLLGSALDVKGQKPAPEAQEYALDPDLAEIIHQRTQRTVTQKVQVHELGHEIER